MKFIKAVLIIYFLLQGLNAYAIQVKEHTLDNGLKVLIVEDHKSPTVTFQIWYRVGSRNEHIGKTGLSHLLEHMMFKGTKKFGPKTFSQTVKRAGGTDNAFTSRDYTGYFELIASDRIDLPIELEADRMRNLVLTDEAVLSERDVVMEERRLRMEDDPQNTVFEEVMAVVFRNHPYRWPVIGWMSDLKHLNPDDLVSHYNTFYNPNNAVIIVVGAINAEDILSKIKQHFGAIPAGPEIRNITIAEDEQKGEKRIFVKKEAELPFMLSAYRVPNLNSDDGFALEVLDYILSQGKSSRLYMTLIYEKQVALSAWSSYEGTSRDPFLFFVGATAAQGKTIDEVETAIGQVIDRIKNEAPSEDEVRKAKNQITASFIMGQDSIYMQARTIGTFEMLGSWRLMDKYLEGISRVSPEEVRRVAEKYLITDNKTTGILIPVPGRNEK